MLLSDAPGWQDADQKEAERLQANGAIVVGIDTPKYIASLSADKGGILLALIILPLYIPLLIFASAAVEQAGFGLNYQAQLAVLAAMLCVALALVPIAVQKALKLNVG